MNVSALTGRLTKDPELRTTPSGKSVTSFTIAVVDPDNKDQTDFIDCVAWNGRAEFLCNYFKKGSKVEITGKIKTRTYEKDGQNRKATEVVASNVNFAESKKDGNGSANANNSQMTDANEDEFASMDVDEDDLPF